MCFQLCSNRCDAGIFSVECTAVTGEGGYMEEELHCSERRKFVCLLASGKISEF